MANEKQALFPGLIGAGVGALASPEKRRGEGALHGAGREIGTLAGIGTGGVTGGLAGLGIGAGLQALVPSQYKGLALAAPAAVGLLGGAGLGGYGGYHAGAGIAKGFTGKNAPWQSKAKKKPAPKKEEENEKDEAPAKAAALNKTIEGIMAKTDLTLSEKAAAVKAALGDPSRSWSEWWDGQEDDLTTAIGIKKSPAYLAQNIRYLENAGRTEDAARLRAALPSNYDPNSESNPYRRVAESRQGLKPVAGSRNDQAAAAAAAEPKPAPAPAAPNHYMNAGLGAAAGGAAGAMLSRKNRVRNALLGAALGGAGTYAGSHLASGGNLNTMLAGLGLGGKTAAYVPPQYPYDANLHQMLSAYEAQQNEAANNKVKPNPMSPEVAKALHGYLSSMHKTPANVAAGVKPMLRKNMQPDELDAVETLMELEDAAPQKSAFDFGKMLGQAGMYAKDLYNKIPAGVRSGVGMGGLGGAALGGLAGLIAPGEEDQYDAMGNVVGRKQRNRFGAALRGALGGGALGAGAGALAGHFAPNQVQGAMNYIQNRGADMRDMMFGKRMDGMSQIPGRALPQTRQPVAPQMGVA